MDLLTVFIVQTRGKDIKCTFGGPDKEGLFTGWVMLYCDNEYDHPLVSTQAQFKSSKDAIKAVEDLVAEVRKMDLKEMMEAKNFSSK